MPVPYLPADTQAYDTSDYHRKTSNNNGSRPTSRYSHHSRGSSSRPRSRSRSRPRSTSRHRAAAALQSTSSASTQYSSSGGANSSGKLILA